MKNKLFRSVRIEIVTYVIISLILSLITTLVITFGLFMLREFIKRGSVNSNRSVESVDTRNASSTAIKPQTGSSGNSQKSMGVSEGIRTVNGTKSDNIISRYQEDVRIKLSENRRFAGFIIL